MTDDRKSSNVNNLTNSKFFQQELFRDLDTILDYSNRFNMLRSRDCNVLSSLFLEGCIQRAQSATRGAPHAPCFAGTSWAEPTSSTRLSSSNSSFLRKTRFHAGASHRPDQDWEGFENLRGDILRRGKFFGNNDDFSNAMARRFHTSLYEFAQGRTDIYGIPLLFGNLTGYNWHFARYGALTQATPDGRVAGSALLFGSGQAEGKDRDGATSQLLAAARMDPTGIMCGDTIMNLSVEEEVVQNDESFDKLVSLVETYFQAGGLHIQLNHVSREDLLAAKVDPNAYKSLRVRVSGFSATFVKLDERIQDNVIAVQNITSEENEMARLSIKTLFSRWYFRCLCYALILVPLFGVVTIMNLDRILFPTPPATPTSGNCQLHAGAAVLDALWLEGRKDYPVLLYSHGNYETLQDIRPLPRISLTGIWCFAYDYAGYGASTGKASENRHILILKQPTNICCAKRRVAENIIPVGFSLALARRYLASKYDIKARAMRAICLQHTALPFSLPEIIQNVNRLASKEIPVLIFHGKKDEIIPYRNSKLLYNKAPPNA